MEKNYTELTGEISNKLQSLQYHPDTIRKYQREWECFKKYLDAHNTHDFSDSLIADYYYVRYNIAFDAPGTEHSRAMRQTKRALETLLEYRKSGIIYRRKPTKNHTWPEAFENDAENFLSMISASRARTTSRQFRSKLESFVVYISDNGCNDFSGLSPNLLKGFWESRSHLSKTTRAYDTYVIRVLLDYLYENRICSVDLSVFVPKIKINSTGQIPSFYTTDELTKLLAMVDRSNPAGKRDYAILLLAIRYGMRVGDIRTLMLTDFDWKNSKLSFIQSKTSKRQDFILLPEVATAIIDYFKNGRPDTDCKYVFIRHNAPYCEFGQDNNLHNIISKYMKMANFTDFHHRKHGLHSLRHSIAGNMLDQGIALPTISEVLGHTSTETTMIYTKISINQLSSCSLEVE